jgi:hypothetical protein
VRRRRLAAFCAAPGSAPPPYGSPTGKIGALRGDLARPDRSPTCAGGRLAARSAGAGRRGGHPVRRGRAS